MATKNIGEIRKGGIEPVLIDTRADVHWCWFLAVSVGKRFK